MIAGEKFEDTKGIKIEAVNRRWEDNRQ